MKILLIAGHGGGDSGAVGNGFREADLTRELVLLIKPKLGKYASVDIFDTSKNAYDIVTKGLGINFKPYTYVFEVHFNASNGLGHGTEVFVTTSEKGTSVEENILNNVVRLGFSNRGLKRKNWAVISSAKRQGVSAALFEVCFIDNKTDMVLYQAKKEAIAQAIADGIASGFGLKGSDSVAKFADTKDHFAEKEIDELNEMGIVNGLGDGTFRPNEPITRAEVAALIRRVIRYITGK